MALFAVQRYMGDECNEEPDEQAEDILQKLNKEALKRKKARSKQKDTGVVEDESPEPKTPSPKKKKKRRHSDKTDDVEEEAEEKTPKKKRKNAKEEKSLEDSVTKTDILEIGKEQVDETEDIIENEDEVEATAKVDVEQMETEQSEQDKLMLDTSGDQLRTEIGGFTVIGDVGQEQQEKVHRVLPGWLAQPSVISEDIRGKQIELSDIDGLDEDILERLRNNGISHFFPVQAQVIPILLSGTENGNLLGKAGYRPNDVCCSAPTGSGKTLAFVLPIIQALKQRIVPRVRALVVLPVGDLATQVYNVFSTYCEGTGLNVGLLCGQNTFASEQNILVRKGLRGFSSKVDIVVTTPGRLVDHISQTEGFDLSHLRYLVIDEADRVIDEIKQDWLAQVEKAALTITASKSNGILSPRLRPLPGPYTASSAGMMELPLQKLLFSATLSQNPEKLQQLNLFQPKLFTSVVKNTKQSATIKNNATSADDDAERNSKDLKETTKNVGEFIGKFTTPAGLTEQYIETDKSSKPLMILHLLFNRKFKGILCFTNSLEDTHRLYLLVKLYGGVTVEEYSSRLHATRRSRILKKFAAGKVDMLICSDTMARGMDVENVQYVISYDPPPYLKTYIHRIGRTARAGKTGTAITLLETKEIYRFKSMIKEAGKGTIKKMWVDQKELKPLVQKYKVTLPELQSVIKAEETRKRKR